MYVVRTSSTVHVRILFRQEVQRLKLLLTLVVGTWSTCDEFFFFGYVHLVYAEY